MSLPVRSGPRFLFPRVELRQCPLNQCHATFHTTRRLCADDFVNPYEVLGLPSSASQSEIKKQYYKLSKTYHPDHNPGNREEASHNFTAISDAYHILGDSNKREKFDREYQRQHTAAGPSSAEDTPTYAGGRKASGLSRRRTPFRGPPPSFYRNGGWGASSAKRTENASTDPRSEDARRAQQQQAQQQQAQQQQAQANAGPYGSMTSNWPFTTDPNDVPHFDREGHYRTTSSIEEQLKKGRQRRRSVYMKKENNMIDDDTPANVIGRFLIILGALVLGVGAPLMVFSGGLRG